MTKLTLNAETQPEQIILDYLEQNASDTLAEKINTGKKTMKQCYTYIKGEAKKQAKDGCAAIEDRVVFGWAVHFFEEDELKAAPERVPLTSEKNGTSGLTMKGSPNLKEIREAKAILEKMEDEHTGADIHPEKKQKQQPKKEPKPKKAGAEQINGQTSIFDFL